MDNNKTCNPCCLYRQLNQRIEQNYADFKANMLLLDSEDIYEMAQRITVVEDAYHQMTTNNKLLIDTEAKYLLKFYNPLEMIADALKDRQDGYPVEIGEALFELFYREDNEENYITVSMANELKQKYGDDVSVEAALLMETIEAGEKYLKLLKYTGDTIDDEVVDD